MSNQPPSEDPTAAPAPGLPAPGQPAPGQPGIGQPGIGQPPPGGYPQMDYPPTAAFPRYEVGPPFHPGAAGQPAGPGGLWPGSAAPGSAAPGSAAPGGVAPRKSNVPLIAVILASTLLLCAGAVVAGVLVVRNVVDSAKEAARDLPTVPTALPTALPTGLPTDLPGLPGWPTDLPTEVPGLPTGGTGRTVKVGYEVDGDGPADITYVTTTGKAPKTVRNAALPWRFTVSMSGISLASVVAVRTDASPGSIRCRTTIDGKQAAQRSGTGEFAVVACTKLIFE